MALPRLLLIDDNKARIQQLESILPFLEYQISTASSSNYISLLNNLDNVHAIFIGNGCEKQATLVKTIKESISNLPLILLIEKGTRLQVPTAIQKMVTQCYEWPSIYPVFSGILNKIPIPKLSSSNTFKKSTINKDLVGKSSGIENVQQLIGQVAHSDATVLILGESGTGKEVVAQAVHRVSNRKDKPFVPINCGAIPGELLESELFGHEKGAFTGALTARQGRFEMAEGGTLFLDEIGDMPMPMQVKLLRVLQERSFERVGSNKTIPCNVRIIAATHRNLEHEIDEKRFREDLFYRLNVFPIELPPLRERTEDIPLLTNELVTRLGITKKATIQFSTDALALMMQHPWPGNVRELSNFIERLAITKPSSLIKATDLPKKFQAYSIPEGLNLDTLRTEEASVEKTIQIEEVGLAPSPSTAINQPLSEKGIDLKGYLSNMEINLIQQALNECNGVVAHAAKLLKMRRTTLVEKLRKYEMSA